MPKKKFEKGSREFKFFADFWQFVQDHYIVDDSDDYWDSILDNGDQLMRKYPEPFFRAMISSFINCAEKINKDQNGHKENY